MEGTSGSGSSYNENSKKRPGRKGWPGRLARHTVDEFTSQLRFMWTDIVGLMVKTLSWKVESLTRCSQGYRRDKRPRASHVCSRRCRNEAASSMTARPTTTSSTLPIFSLPATTASPPLVRSSARSHTWLPGASSEDEPRPEPPGGSAVLGGEPLGAMGTKRS